jgi:sugar lactone lactonase YvrE
LAAAAQVPTIEKIIQIGCSECDGPAQFSTIFDVAATDSGDMIIVDKGPPMIRAFDRTGRVLWTGGRTGGGPGEYQFPMRVAIGPDRSVSVVDMRARRMTRLARDGSVKATEPILAFPAAAGARGRTGELIVLTDDFRGPFALERWAPGAAKAVPHATIPRAVSAAGRAIVQPSIAVAPSGVLAFGTDPFTYRIGRLAADGSPMPDIVRDIPRARRTEAEMQELANRLAQGPLRQSAERSVSKAPPSAAAAAVDLTMKPFFPLDGLRYDDLGRLWVLTTRGAEQQTVFDVFAATGTFLGSVTVPVHVGTFALAGPHLITGGEDVDGIPRVTLWRVRG